MAGWQQRVVAWGVRRTLKGRGDGDLGLLLWVDNEGAVHELDAFTLGELEDVGQVMATAWRLTRERSERTKLAPITHVGARLARAARRLARELQKG